VKLASARVDEVLENMVQAGYLSPEQARNASQQPLRLSARGDDTGYPYPVDFVAELLPEFVGEQDGDLIVETTIDAGLQRVSQQALRLLLDEEGADVDAGEGAVVVLDPLGGVKALVGGRSYSTSPFDRALKALRQPGSAFKPFVYLAAMEKGYTPETVADDAPFEYNGWAPENASGKYLGPVTLRNALAFSLNTVSGRLAIDVGPDKVVEAAMRLGISSPMQPVPSIALGTSEVSLLELTAAYAPFANGGIGVIANVITRIETVDGEVLYEAIPAGPGQVIQPEVVAEMNDMLTTALEIGTGKKAQLDGWPIAGKTGTSQKARDAVFVGFSARMVTGVWLGNDDDTATKLSGGNVPVEIWSEFMSKAHQGMAVAQLPGVSGAQVTDVALQPMEQPEQPKRTLVDLLGDIFSGGQ
jgi:penicillin-binding protein 1A